MLCHPARLATDCFCAAAAIALAAVLALDALIGFVYHPEWNKVKQNRHRLKLFGRRRIALEDRLLYDAALRK